MPDGEERIRELEQKNEELQKELRVQAEELGRLRAVAERTDEVTAELNRLRDENGGLRGQLDDLRARLDQRVSEEVEAAVAAVKEEYERNAQAAEAERQRLLERIAALEKGEAGAAPAVATDELASQFRSVLESLAEPEPEGGAAGAAMTGLEVEARAMLAPPAEGEELPRLVMVDPTKVTNPDALSTVRLRFGLLPRLPSEEPPPDG
jgi:chromosome segregation ATPase